MQKRSRKEERAKRDQYERTPRGRASKLLRSARSRAKARGVTCTLTLDWLEQKLKDGRCEATGLPLDLTRHPHYRTNPWSPSVDRRRNTDPYTPENSMVVCTAYNRAKSEWHEVELLALALAVTKKYYPN